MITYPYNYFNEKIFFELSGKANHLYYKFDKKTKCEKQIQKV